MSRSVRELHEEVYDSGTHLDEKCSLIDEDYWYENDLVLAAELGKTLLERNKELEKQLVQSQRENSDHLVEIDLLTKQLNTLRELSQSKMRIYEEVDKQCTELERSNKALKAENKADKQRIQSLTDQIVALEAHQEELREQLERSRRKEDAKSALPRPERRVRKSRSVPSVADLPPGPRHRQYQPDKTNEDRQTNADIDEVIRLHDKLCELSFQVTSERRKRESLESEARLQMLENEDLRGVISSLRSELLALRTAAEQAEASDRCPRCCRPGENGLQGISSEEEEEEEQLTVVKETSPFPEGSPRSRKQDAVAKDLFSGVEHDAVSVREGEIGRLKSGGKVFSSRESLNRVGAEAATAAEKSGDISLLAELDTQYNKLVRQYEDLIATKQPDGANDVTSGAAATAGASTDAATEATATAAHFEKKLNAIFSEETRRQRKTMITPNYRPQYKQLFREAFSVLKDMKNKGQEGQPNS